eukprot:TRINITY_DN83152_c0_g1_i1.p1 TRINITY_DN83152_c0_g1~~TRINITY_DN83152_c0_g1_i1.p1  ORF type:complete len:432 (+),score=37.14 TRINITY_DN83152_c0_g1_i1:70-1365(+)
MPKVSGTALWTVYVVQAMDTLNFGIVFPLLPVIAKRFDADDAKVGSLATTYAIASFVFTPILGRISDRVGRRPVLLVAIAGSVIAGILTGAAESFPVLLLARMSNGVCGGTGGVANAYVADVTTAEEKPIYMSYVSGANSLGLILGPALGGVMLKWGLSTACYASAGLSALNFLVCALLMPESRWVSSADGSAFMADQREGASNAGADAENRQPSPPRVPAVAWFLFAASFLFVLAFAAFETVTGYFLMDSYFHGDSVRGGQTYGMIFVIVGIVLFVSSTFIYKPVYNKLGPKWMITLGVLVRSTGFVFMAVSPTWQLFLFSVLVQVMGSSFIFPTTSATLTTLCSKEIYGRALSYNEAAGALARVVGPLCFGTIYDDVTHKFSFYACAVAGLFAGVLVLCALRRAPKTAARDVAPAAGEALRLERQITPV